MAPGAWCDAYASCSISNYSHKLILRAQYVLRMWCELRTQVEQTHEDMSNEHTIRHGFEPEYIGRHTHSTVRLEFLNIHRPINLYSRTRKSFFNITALRVIIILNSSSDAE